MMAGPTNCPECGGNFETCSCTGGYSEGPNACPICQGPIPCLKH